MSCRDIISHYYFSYFILFKLKFKVCRAGPGHVGAVSNIFHNLLLTFRIVLTKAKQQQQQKKGVMLGMNFSRNFHTCAAAAANTWARAYEFIFFEPAVWVCWRYEWYLKQTSEFTHTSNYIHTHTISSAHIRNLCNRK